MELPINDIETVRFSLFGRISLTLWMHQKKNYYLFETKKKHLQMLAHIVIMRKKNDSVRRDMISHPSMFCLIFSLDVGLC